MPYDRTKAEEFRRLHVPGEPLVLFNAWDAGSAKAVAAAGAKAIATSSWSVAAANGFGDGEKLPLELALDNLARIIPLTDLPVTVDIEKGYSDPARTVERTIEIGAIGCNVEDSFPGSELRTIRDQSERIGAMRKAADALGKGYFINARTDVFFQGPSDRHDMSCVNAAAERGRAYADAGADGLFAPGLVDPELTFRLAQAVPLPLNIMIDDTTPRRDELLRSGVARVSYGPAPYLIAMQCLEESARIAFLSACGERSEGEVRAA
jgi:2-methylisocitrate lyase-like PEP mutase family enzyme